MISVLVVSIIVFGGTALVLTLALLFAEDGYEDETGFHFANTRQPSRSGRARRRPQRRTVDPARSLHKVD